MEFLLIIILAVIWGLICYKLAGDRNRNKNLGFFLGFFFGIFAVIGYLLAGKSRTPCPFCKEKIDKEAKICPYCQSKIKD